MHLVGGEVVVDVEVMSGWQVVFLAELKPLQRKSHRTRFVHDLISESPMKHSSSVSFECQTINTGGTTAIEVWGISKIFRIGTEGDFPQVPESWMIVVQISCVIDMRILQELANRIAVNTSTLNFREVAVLEGDFHARPKSP